MKRVFNLIKNKYLVACAVFFAWMLFFDRHDLATQYSYYSELKDLEREKAFYEVELQRIGKGLDDLKNNPAEVERIARERYQMKKEAEDVFILVYEQ